MEFPERRPINGGVNRKEEAFLKIINKYKDYAKCLAEMKGQTSEQNVGNSGEDSVSQNPRCQNPAVNLVSNEVTNQDAGGNLENVNENNRVDVTEPVGVTSKNSGSNMIEEDELENKFKDAMEICYGNKQPDSVAYPLPTSNQPEVSRESIGEPTVAHCSTNPAPRPPPPTTTTLPSIVQPKPANPFRRGIVIVKSHGKIVADAKFQPCMFKKITSTNFARRLDNLRAIYSSCMSALQLCTEKMVALNDGITSLQNGNESENDRPSRGEVDFTEIEDNIANIQTNSTQLRTLAVKLNESIQLTERDGHRVKDGLDQLNNSNGELTQTVGELRNEVSQILAQLTQFGNRWGEQGDAIQQLILVTELLRQDAIERKKDVANVNKSLVELKNAEARLHDQSSELMDSIRRICEKLREELDVVGVGGTVQDLQLETASKFDKHDERGEQVEISIGEFREEVAIQFREQKERNERLVTEIARLRHEFSCFTKAFTELDNGTSSVEEDESVRSGEWSDDGTSVLTMDSIEEPEEGQGSTEQPIANSAGSEGINDEADNVPDSASAVSSNRNLEAIGGNSGSNRAQSGRPNLFSPPKASASSKRVLDSDSEASGTLSAPRHKQVNEGRLARPSLYAGFSSSSESLESPSEIESSSDWFADWGYKLRKQTTNKKTKVADQALEPKRTVLKNQVTKKVSIETPKPTKKRSVENHTSPCLTSQRARQEKDTDAAASTAK